MSKSPDDHNGSTVHFEPDCAVSDQSAASRHFGAWHRSRPDESWGCRQVLTTLFAGVICGLLAVMFSMAAATLLFADALSDYITTGIGLSIFGTAVLCCVIALSSSYPGMISLSQEITAVTLAVIATSIYSTMDGIRNPDEILATIVVMIAIATSLTGLGLMALGVFRMGRIIQFIPYPVIGGFLAGMGWLILIGAVSVILGDAPSVQNIHILLEPSNVAKIVPAIMFSVGVGVIARRSGNSLNLPFAVVSALLLFHLIIWWFAVPIASLQDEGWLFKPSAEEKLWPPFDSNPLPSVDWAAIWSELPKMTALIAITATSVLFAARGIEFSTQRTIKLDDELKAAGLGNLLAGFGGGAAGFQGLGLTLLSDQLGAPYRLVGLIVAMVCATTLFFGTSLLMYVPIPLFGALLLWVGLSLLYDWLVETYHTVPLTEYALIFLILLVIGAFGILEGILTGSISAVILFVVAYGKLEVVKGPTASESLSTGQSLVLRLHGFVFFGNVHSLQRVIANRLNDDTSPRLLFFILDCRDVIGLDSSATVAIEGLRTVLRKSGVRLQITNLCETIKCRPDAADFALDGQDSIVELKTLNHAAELRDGKELQDD